MSEVKKGTIMQIIIIIIIKKRQYSHLELDSSKQNQIRYSCNCTFYLFAFFMLYEMILNNDKNAPFGKGKLSDITHYEISSHNRRLLF